MPISRERVRCSAVISHFQALCHCIALTWRLHQTVESLIYTSLGNLCRQWSPSCTCTKYLSKNFMSPSLPTHLAKGAPTIQTHLIYSLPCLFKKSIQRGKRLTIGWLALSFGANQDDVESLTGASSFVGSGCGVLTEESTGSSPRSDPRRGSSCAMTSVMPRTSRNAKDHFMKDLVGHHHWGGVIN